MKVDIKGLLEGIGNSLFVKEEVEKIARDRIEICNGCEHYSPNWIARGAKFSRPDKFCTDCGCNMYLKTRSLAASCPLGSKDSHFPNEVSKWPAVTSDEQATQIENTQELKKEMDDYKLKLMRNQVTE